MFITLEIYLQFNIALKVTQILLLSPLLKFLYDKLSLLKKNINYFIFKMLAKVKYYFKEIMFISSCTSNIASNNLAA